MPLLSSGHHGVGGLTNDREDGRQGPSQGLFLVPPKNRRVGCLTWWSCSVTGTKGWTKCGVAPGMVPQQLFPHSKLPRTQPDGTSIPGEPASPISQRLPPKVESLESLYFTPIPARGQAPLESSLDSLGDISLDSSRKTRSARRRTTQIINITMTKVSEARLLGVRLQDSSACFLPRASLHRLRGAGPTGPHPQRRAAER